MFLLPQRGPQHWLVLGVLLEHHPKVPKDSQRCAYSTAPVFKDHSSILLRFLSKASVAGISFGAFGFLVRLDLAKVVHLVDAVKVILHACGFARSMHAGGVLYSAPFLFATSTDGSYKKGKLVLAH